jgi:hypothetical protein
VESSFDLPLSTFNLLSHPKSLHQQIWVLSLVALAQEQLLKLLLKVSLASQHILDQDSKHWDQFLGLLGSRDSLELVYLEVVSLLPVVLVVALLLVVQQVALQVLQLLAGLLVLLLLVVDLLLWPHLVQDLLVWLLGVGLVV